MNRNKWKTNPTKRNQSEYKTTPMISKWCIMILTSFLVHLSKIPTAQIRATLQHPRWPRLWMHFPHCIFWHYNLLYSSKTWNTCFWRLILDEKLNSHTCKSIWKNEANAKDAHLRPSFHICKFINSPSPPCARLHMP